MHLETSLNSHSAQKKKHLLPPVSLCYRNSAERQHQFVYVTEKVKEKRWMVREKEGKRRRKQRESERT